MYQNCTQFPVKKLIMAKKRPKSTIVSKEYNRVQRVQRYAKGKKDLFLSFYINRGILFVYDLKLWTIVAFWPNLRKRFWPSSKFKCFVK